MAVTQLGKDNFDAVVSGSDAPVLIDFYADWCGPCHMLAPIVDEVAAEREDVRVCRVNVDEENELAARFGVSAIPMLVVMRDGKPDKTAVGYMPKEEVLALLD